MSYIVPPLYMDLVFFVFHNILKNIAISSGTHVFQSAQKCSFIPPFVLFCTKLWKKSDRFGSKLIDWTKMSARSNKIDYEKTATYVSPGRRRIPG